MDSEEITDGKNKTPAGRELWQREQGVKDRELRVGAMGGVTSHASWGKWRLGFETARDESGESTLDSTPSPASHAGAEGAKGVEYQEPWAVEPTLSTDG